MSDSTHERNRQLAGQLLAEATAVNVEAIRARARLRDAWAAVESQQKLAAAEWAEANRYFVEQTAALDARAAELTRCEKELANTRADAEAATAGLREEEAALERRILGARTTLAELERRRERARDELLGTQPADPGATAHHEQLTALKSSLEHESADLDDRRRVVGEQLSLLTEARAQWQRAERQTVLEMEGFARDLWQREQELDARERRLIRADLRRREEAYDLWQLRMRLEVWQGKLTAAEVRWEAEREEYQAELDGRTAALLRRESELAAIFAQWEKARAIERERLRGELELWAAERERLTKAVAEFALQRQVLEGELSTYAARAVAAQQVVTEVRGSGTERRRATLQKRWERVFDRKVKELDTQRVALAAERSVLDERLDALHRLMIDVLAREADVENREAAIELRGLDETHRHLEPVGAAHVSNVALTAELVTLRGEVERLAAILIDVELPEALERPERELPLAVEESDSATVLPFDADSRAA